MGRELLRARSRSKAALCPAMDIYSSRCNAKTNLSELHRPRLTRADDSFLPAYPPVPMTQCYRLSLLVKQICHEVSKEHSGNKSQSAMIPNYRLLSPSISPRRRARDDFENPAGPALVN